MSPPSDGARPVVWQTRLADHHGWLDCTEGQFEDHRKHGFQVRALYTAADYDALRAEVERLLDHAEVQDRIILWEQERQATIVARAEAAEAQLRDLIDKHRCALLLLKCDDEFIDKQLSGARAALNEGDGE